MKYMKIEVTEEEFVRLEASIKFGYLSPERREELREIGKKMKEANDKWEIEVK